MRRFDALKFFIDAKELVYDISLYRDDYVQSLDYKDAHGNQCLIGEMIDPSTYNPDMEKSTVKELIALIELDKEMDFSQSALLRCLTESFGTMTKEDLELVAEIQAINDNFFVSDWIKHIKRIEQDWFISLTEEDYTEYGLPFPENQGTAQA